jgi:hypothetical protein
MEDVMLLIIGLVLLAAWVIGAILPHGFGSLVNILLLVGLMLVLLAFAKGRDEALHPRGNRPSRPS